MWTIFCFMGMKTVTTSLPFGNTLCILMIAWIILDTVTIQGGAFIMTDLRNSTTSKVENQQSPSDHNENTNNNDSTLANQINGVSNHLRDDTINDEMIFPS